MDLASLLLQNAPLLTEMQSLAIALYFAARGRGQVQSSTEVEPIAYTSPARVLLSGLGSDELMGGYSRHRTVYEAGGWEALINEVKATRSFPKFPALIYASCNSR